MGLDYLRVGKITNTHGIKGEVRVFPLTDNVERFNDLKYVYINDEKMIKTDIQYVRYHKNSALIKFKGIDHIDEAEKLKNNYILINRENAVKLPEGSYFICDIIGLDVYDVKDQYLGKIQDIISTGSNDVYVITNDKKELLIPALKSVVKIIDLQRKRVIVDPPEGL